MRLQRPTAGLSIAIALGCGGDPQESMLGSAEGSSSGATTGSSSTTTVTTMATSQGTTLGTGESGSQGSTDAPETSGGSQDSGGSSTTTDADASAGESSSAGSSSSETGGNACTQTDDAPGGMCPEECTSCVGNVCHIDCTVGDSCEQLPVVCPTDFACEVSCTGNNVCHATNISCPKSWPCTVTCAGPNACHATEIGAGDGPTDVYCNAPDDDVCHDLLLHCGAADGVVHCDEGQMLPAPDPPKAPSDCQCSEVNC